MPPASAPPLQVRDGPPAGPGGGGKMCSGAWKRGPEIAIAMISLWLKDLKNSDKDNYDDNP